METRRMGTSSPNIKNEKYQTRRRIAQMALDDLEMTLTLKGVLGLEGLATRCFEVRIAKLAVIASRLLEGQNDETPEHRLRAHSAPRSRPTVKRPPPDVCGYTYRQFLKPHVIAM